LEQYAKIITTYDINVSNITKAYRNRSFDKQNNVLLVAHSQGNIVGNKVYTQLTSTQKSKFRMVSVGTPADHVAGGGPHVTGYLDFVINNPFIPNSLPANIQVFGHNFISSYLSLKENDKGRAKIIQHVINAYNNLGAYTGCSRYDSINLYVNGLNDTVLAKGKIRGANASEIISKQTVEAREVDDECKEHPQITGDSALYHYLNHDFLWLISPFQTQEEVQANQSATLKYKNLEGKCVDISFQETMYDIVYQGLAK
jgi:hypothetical protein